MTTEMVICPFCGEAYGVKYLASLASPTASEAPVIPNEYVCVCGAIWYAGIPDVDLLAVLNDANAAYVAADAALDIAYIAYAAALVTSRTAYAAAHAALVTSREAFVAAEVALTAASGNRDVAAAAYAAARGDN